MTVNTTQITSGPYLGNDIADEFDYDFRIEDKTQLTVYETDDTGVETTLTVDTDYTVADIGVDAGGSVTRVAGALPTGYSWYIRSNYEQTQKTAFASQGGFFPDVHEAAMDKLTFLIQQMTDILGRSMRVSESYTGGTITALPDPEAAKFLKWKTDLSGFENAELIAGTIVAGLDIGDVVQLIDDGGGNGVFPLSVIPPGVLQNIVEDLTPQLGGPLDTNSHQVQESLGAAVASASELPVLTDGNVFPVTGTTNIDTIVNIAIGTKITLIHGGILDLVHSSSLILKNDGGNITTAVGDVSKWYQKTDTVWEMTDYQRASGRSVSSTAFYDAYLKYSDVKATSVGGGTSSAGTQVRTLNTEDSDTAGIGSLSSNQITLPAGSYKIFATVPGAACEYHKASIYDTTGAAVLLLGSSERSETSAGVSNRSVVCGIIDLSVESAIEVRHYTSSSKATIGLGYSVNDGSDEIYTTIEIWRLN